LPGQRIGTTKARHEVRRYLRLQQLRVYRDSDIVSRIDRLTIDISPAGSGSIHLPSPAIFERINPSTAPLGLVFVDGSFLIFKEIVRYGYIDKKAAAPQVYRLEYSYHYQRPAGKNKRNRQITAHPYKSLSYSANMFIN